MKELRYLNKYLAQYKYRLLLGFLFIVASNTFRVWSPGIVADAIDLVKDNIESMRGANAEGAAVLQLIFKKELLKFIGLILLFALAEGFFLFWTRQMIIVVSRMIEFDLRNEVYAHYQELDTAFYKRNNTGDLMSRITEDINRVRMYLGPAIMYSLNLVVMIVMAISFMLEVNVKLTLLVLSPLPILSISIYYVNTLINKGSERIQGKLADLTTHAQEFYSGIRVIKSYVQERMISRFFGAENDRYKDLSLDLARIEAMFFPLMLLLIGLSTIITIYAGGVEVHNGNMSAGKIAQFVIYVNMLTWPVTSIGWVAAIIQRAAASQKRINEFLKVEPNIRSNVGDRPDLKGSIAFEQVGFTYPDTGIRALNGLDFKIEAGERWAIVGRTGSGKSSLADLLLRMYDPTEGRILVDGKDIKTLDPGHYRSQIGYVPQDVFLFSDTIENNIGFGSEQDSVIPIRKAAKMANISSEIESFKESYETMVGERGVTLSGGQKQRISIARALRKNPSILLLDDSLSAVDARTEDAIINQLNDYMQERTSIIITHRIFALLNFDRIMVLDEGNIVEQGTHEELLALGGSYAELYEKQQEEEQI